jgi:hypothetical protein
MIYGAEHRTVRVADLQPLHGHVWKIVIGTHSNTLFHLANELVVEYDEIDGLVM